jgi:hypothetical protein
VSSLQTARFASEKGWQRDLSASQRATARWLASSSFSPDLSQLVRRVDSPSSHASRPPAKKADFTRNRTRPTTKSHPFPLPKTHTKATGDDGGDFRCAEKKGGKSDPRVRFLVKECAEQVRQDVRISTQTMWLSRSCLTCLTKSDRVPIPGDAMQGRNDCERRWFGEKDKGRIFVWQRAIPARFVRQGTRMNLRRAKAA